MQHATTELPTNPIPSFNPHPSRRTGATRLAAFLLGGKDAVSILTRPGGRVQLQPSVGEAGSHPRFNPHPSRRTGATREVRTERPAPLVSILTRPGGRVQRRTTALNSTQLSSFSAKQRR